MLKRRIIWGVITFGVGLILDHMSRKREINRRARELASGQAPESISEKFGELLDSAKDRLDRDKNRLEEEMTGDDEEQENGHGRKQAS